MFNTRFFGTASIILAALLIMGCHNQESPLSDFEKVSTTTLSGEQVKLLGDTVLYSLGNFRVEDSIGIFNDNVGKSAFAIVNLKTGKLMRRFGFAGDDESAFDINSVTISPTAFNNRVFTVLQANQPCKVVRYNLDSLLQRSDYKPSPFFYPQNFGYSYCVLLNDSTLFGRVSFSKFDDKTYAVTILSSKKLLTGIDVPRSENSSEELYYSDSLYYKVLKNLLNTKVKMRPGSNYQFASFSKDGAVIQLFDVNKDGVFKVRYEKVYYLPSFTIVRGKWLTKPRTNPDTKWGFNDLAVTKDRIYGLFNGPDLTIARSESDDILVYDWNGKPLERFKLDQRCFSIAIDHCNPRVLYGLYGDGVIHLVKYKLP